MIDSMNIVLTSKNASQQKVQKFERLGLTGLSLSQDNQFLLLIEEEKLGKKKSGNTHEHITWIPTKDIIEVQVDIYKSPDPVETKPVTNSKEKK